MRVRPLIKLLTKSSEVLLLILILISRSESVLWRQLMPSLVSLSNRDSCLLSIGFCEKVLTSNIRDVAIVTRDMLETDLVGGSSDPILCQPALVSIDLYVRLVLANRISPIWGSWVKANRMCSSWGHY